MALFQDELNQEQQTAVRHTGSPLLVLAGAGSGKTKVLTYRALNLIRSQQAKAEEIVLLTFTNKAAAEMKKRIAQMANGKWQMEEIGFAGTFHTFCARLLRAYGQLVGLAPNFIIYDTDDSEAVLKTVVKNMGLELKSNRPGMFLHLISRLKNDLASYEELAVSARDDFYKKLVSVWKSYDEHLRMAKAVDFDDLLVFMVKLLSLPSMKEKLKRKYRYVLVDEYQDTNKAQFLITKLLAEANPIGLTVVGDAAQAIYSFRGADFRNLSLLSTEYPSLTTIRLSKNYRSTQTILDAAYGVIANNKNHPILKLTANKSTGSKVEMVEAMDEREEAAYIVRVGERLLFEGGSLAVLYRTNAQSRALEEALIRKRVDYKLVGGIRFYDRAEVKDLLSYLRVIYNDADTVSWQRIEKMGKRKKVKFIEWLAKNKAELPERYPHEILDSIIGVTEYRKHFDEKDEEDLARIENIKELLAVASEFSTLVSFLESIALIQSEELAEKKNGGARVTLMTIHSAKGLEFDEVVIVGLEEGLLPHSRSLLERDELEEERRLMYVAMTRAREKLHLTFTRSRLVYGGRQASSPSRFLAEIPGKLLNIAGGSYSFRDDEGGDEAEAVYSERRIVVDWETEGTVIARPSKQQVERETQADFDEIDAW